MSEGDQEQAIWLTATSAWCPPVNYIKAFVLVCLSRNKFHFIKALKSCDEMANLQPPSDQTAICINMS